MADVSVADFRARYPQFAAGTYPDDTVALAVADARELTDVSTAAVLACTAHLLTLASQETLKASGGSGVVKSETIGPKMVAYVTQAENAREAFFGQTAYGERVLAIERRSPATFSAMVV